MSLKSSTKVLHSQDGYEISVKDGLVLPEDSAALLLAGSDGNDSHHLLLDEEGRKMLAGAGSSGSPSGGILSIQGTGGTGDEIKIMGHLDIDNFPADLSIVQNNASELLASVGGLGGSGSALVGNPVRLGLKNETDGTTLDILSDSSGRLLVVGAASSGDPLAGAPVRIGASDGTGNAINVLADAAGRLVRVGAAAAGDAVAGAPVRLGGSDSADTTDILTDSAGRLIFAGAAADGSAVVGSPVRLGASDSGDVTRDILSDDQGRLIMVGANAAGSAPSGNPVLAGGSDGTNVQIFKLDNAGALQVSQVKSSDATLYTTTATTSAASLLASNVAREGAIVYNNSNRFLYVKLGSSITYSSFTTKIAPFGQYLVPSGFTGEISGTWNDATATGSAIVTEFAPGGGGGGGPTDPSLTNLRGWYRADDIGLSNGASVTGWEDRQGTSDLTRVYNGPIYYNSSNSEFNNQPTLNFGSGGLIDSWNTPSFDLGPRLAGNTIIMVVKPVYEGGGGNHLLWLPGGYPYDGQGYNIYANDMGGALGSAIKVVGYNGSGTILKTVEPNKPLIIYVSYEYETNTNANTLQIFGASSTFVPEWSWGGASLMSGGGNTGDGAMPIYGTPGKFQLGYSLGTNTAEVLYYNAVQGAQEKTDTIAYLSSRYGISV